MISQGIGTDFKHFLRSKSLLSNLFIANIIVALFMLTTAVLKTLGYPFYDWILRLFAVHANTEILLKTPWSILSYAFIHISFWNLLFSSAMLYFVGILCSRYLGQKRFIATYFVGAVVGALFFVAAYNLIPAFAGAKAGATVVSASPAVLAIFFACATYIPDYKIFRNIKLKHLAYVFAGLEIVALFGADPAIHIASIGAGLYGILAVYVPRKIKTLTTASKAKAKTAQSKTEHKRPLTDEEYNRQRAEKQKQIDAILDKISKSGYESLTAKEKEILFKESK